MSDTRSRVPGYRRAQLLAALLAATTSAVALDTETIVSSALSTDCLDYRVVGICYWLYCTTFGCKVRTSTKVRHYVPDAVVSSYAETGLNPWSDVDGMSGRTSGARSGGNATTHEQHENNIAKFKNADVIGHPAGWVFDEFASESGYTCPGAATTFMPYLLSTLDVLAWRHYLPEAFYAESGTPGTREVGSRSSGDMWGNVYPRGGFTHQTDDHKAAAVVAQRAGDIVTRRSQPHVYWPVLATPKPGYWPAGALVENDISTGKWQELTPTLSNRCAVFPHGNERVQDKRGAYAWALWRPYACCKRRGQVFLGSVEFE